MDFKSQVGQDEWVCASLNNKRGGYFIDVGACDGVWFSNTYVLEKELGWTGICVEPARTPFAELIQTRNCICVNKAVYDRTGMVKFHEYDGAVWKGHIDSMGYDIDCITLRDLIKEYDCPKIIDYISIDVEGLEYEILTGFPFEDYKARIWTVEHNDWTGEKKKKMREFMVSHGFKHLPDSEKSQGYFEDWFYLGGY